MKTSITVNTLIPPSTNNLYTNIANGGRTLSKAYKQWRMDAGRLLTAQRPGRIMGEVDLHIEMHRPNSRSDIGNRIKALEDLLVENYVIEDDRRVHLIEIHWSDEVETCRVTITKSARKGLKEKK